MNSESEALRTMTEPLTVVIKSGRPKKYNTEEEKEDSKRRNALKCYYRRKAVEQFMKENDLLEISKQQSSLTISYVIPERSKMKGTITELFRIIVNNNRPTLKVVREI